MERRNRDRLNITAFCRITPAGKGRRSSWKRIENISGAGILLDWSRGEEDIPPPHVGDGFVVELQLPAHPVFGQRALRFKTKVVRVVKQANGKVKAGLQTTQRGVKIVRPGSWTEQPDAATVN